MAITYDSVNNIVTITGYTEATPCTFLDIWNADQAGGWGVVSKQGNLQFLLTTKLQIGDGSTVTWFADMRVQVHWDGQDISVDVKNNGHFRLGEIVDATKKTTRYGVQMIVEQTGGTNPIISRSGSEVLIYSSHIIAKTPSYSLLWFNNGIVKIYNTQLDYVGVFPNGNANLDIYNVLIVGADYAISYGFVGTLEKLTTYNCYYPVYFYDGASATVKDLVTKDHNRFDAGAITVDQYLINPDLDPDRGWFFRWAGTSTANVLRQYEFNRKILKEDGTAYNGKSWTLKDKDGTTVASGTTQADGKLSATDIVVTHGYYDQANGNTEQLSSPFDLWVDGETDYLDLNIYKIPLDAKDVEGIETMVDISTIRKYLTNRWKIENNQMKVYDDDDTTVIKTFDLKDVDGNATMTNVRERVPA